MLNLNNITKLEKKIKADKLLIQKKKKSIPYFITAAILIYLVILNLRDKELSSYFDNHLHFIKILTFVFIGIIIVYFSFIFYQILIISKHVKQQNIALFKLSKLDKTEIQNTPIKNS